MLRSVALENRRRARGAVAGGLLAVAGSAVLDAAATCRARPGECAIVSTRSGSTWEEIVVQVSDAAGGFTLDLARDGRALTLVWKAPADGRLRACAAPEICPAAEPPVCEDAVVCGLVHSTSYCGSFLSSDTVELRFRWCRAEDDPWPLMGAPLPIQNPPPPPPPKKKPKLPEDERRDPPGPPKAPEEAEWFVERIQKANAIDRPWQAEGNLTTRKGLPSAVAARHVPGVSWMSAGVAGEAPTEAFVATNGRMVARRGSSGVYLEIRPEPGSEPPSGGFTPTPNPAPAISPLLGRPGAPKKKKSGSFADFGPGSLTAALDPDAVDYYGLETCGGAVLAGVLCHRLDFRDDGVPNSAYFAEESLLLESIVGADRNGPRKLVWRYAAVAVDFPHASQVRQLSGDPQKDMAAMMSILGPP